MHCLCLHGSDVVLERCGLARPAVCGEAVVHDAWRICYLVSGAVGDHVNVRMSVPCGRGGMACVGRLRGGVGVERACEKLHGRPACDRLLLR